MAIKVLLLLGVLVIAILLRVPVFLSLALSVITFGLVFPRIMPLEVLGQGLVSGLTSYSYAGVVFFFFAGEIMSCGGISKRLIAFFDTAIGHIQGGLSHVNVLESMLFAGMSGSALADTAATSTIMVPAMTKQGYSPEYAVAITIASSTIGPIIPPSTGLILLAIYTGASTVQCLMGGLVPGLCMGGFLLLASWYISKKRNYPRKEWAGWSAIIHSLGDNFLALLLPVLIVICLSSGLGTVNEIGAVSCVYAILVSCVFYKDLDMKGLLEAVVRAAKTSGRMLCILGMAGIFTWIVGSIGIRSALTRAMEPFMSHPILLLSVSMLILGCFLDHTIIMYVIAPIMAPAIIAAGIDIVQYCVLTMIVCTMGLITPPVGMLIYIGSSIADVNPMKVIKELTPFLIALIVLVVLLILFPGITTAVPTLLYR